MHLNSPMHALLNAIPANRPVLIAGPTASGKSDLALRIAEAQGGVIVNADASQVFDCWRIVTARPSAADEAGAPHLLYGHLPYDAPYSVGHWLREMAEVLARGERLIVVGGTGLYLSALTEGLVDIPPVPADVRSQADALSLDALRAGVDAETLAGLDKMNRARVQRAWEVENATGRSLASWQKERTAPLLPLHAAHGIVVDAPKTFLTPRIEARFALMVKLGALDEVAAMRNFYDSSLPSFKAIGVPQLMAFIDGHMTEDEAIERASIATRQFAKRQRTWFRARMQQWQWIDVTDLVST